MYNLFSDEKENKKYQDFFKNNIIKDINEITLSKDIDIIKYLEFVVSALLLEINKRFSEPNYSIYITYRIKSQKSDLAKLKNYVNALKENNNSVSIRDITDLIGLRIIIEKIPHNITISKDNPEYEIFANLCEERKQNIKISEQFHQFEAKIYDNNCTKFEYFEQSKILLQSILKMFDSETIYSKVYAIDLKQKYGLLIDECEKKLKILSALGEYSSKFDINSLKDDAKIDFFQLLKDFDSRIDSKLGLKLYSNALPDIIKKSPLLQSLGVSISEDTSRLKIKREKSGYVSDFFGLDFSGIPIKAELQDMYSNEHQESIIGYSAHGNMPGKEAVFTETPPEYVRRNMSNLENMGNSTFISNDELHLIDDIASIKKSNIKNQELIRSFISPSNVVLKDNVPIGIKIDSKYLQDFKQFCKLSEEETNILKEALYNKGCAIFDAWAKNISAFHATARIDKDSSAKNRVKIHYDDAYECLAHAIREEINIHNPNSINTEYYLKYIYMNQSKWLKNNGLMSKESSIIDFEINEYIENSLPTLIQKVSTITKKENEDIER